MMRKSLLIAVLCGLILPLAMNVAATQSPSPDSRTSINIISYNIRMNTTADGVNAWPLRTEKVTGLLRFHQADIFGVQEALPEQVRDLEKAFPGFDHYGVGRDDGVSRGEHMSVFYLKSRFEKLDAGTFWLNETTDKPGLGWDAAYNRTCTWIKLRDRNTGKSFLLFNTHFDNRGAKARAESSALILQFMKKINQENLPFILTGDFNTTRESEPVLTLLSQLKNSRAVSETTPYGPEGTSGGFEVADKNRNIDFIFVSDKVKVLRHGHLSDSFGLFYPSDHLPVLAEVEVL